MLHCNVCVCVCVCFCEWSIEGKTSTSVELKLPCRALSGYSIVCSYMVIATVAYKFLWSGSSSSTFSDARLEKLREVRGVNVTYFLLGGLYSTV